MSAYLKFYALEHSPFEAEAQSKSVLGTKALRDALSAIRSGLQDGSARICVSGQSGLGKTSLARALPKLLREEAQVAVILDPSAAWGALRGSIAKQWGVGEAGLARSNLISTCRETRLVLVIDKAESACDDFLDHLDVLLSYRSDRDEPVVQSVLFANLTQRSGEAPASLLWWLDRIQTLQLQFAPLPRDGVGSYIQKHLKRAGWRGDSLFSPEAACAIHGHTGGIPGEISAACERLLREAATRDLRVIDAGFVHQLLDADHQIKADVFEDEFDDLALEEEFEGAEESSKANTETSPSLTETLEHFAPSSHVPVLDSVAESHDAKPAVRREVEPDADAASAPSDASLAALEAYLSRPATEEELREIRGSGLQRLVRNAVGLAMGAVIAGIAIAWLLGDAPSAVTERIDASASMATRASPNPEPGIESTPHVLARIRGPVLDTQPSPRRVSQRSGRITSAGDSPTEGAPAFPAAPASDGFGESDSEGRFR